MSIEEIWDRGSLIFKHEDRLSIDYVPMYLPHRKRHLEMLARMFIQVVKNPRSFSQRVILGGPVGTGKTAVAKSFGKKVENYSLRRNINIRYAHVNCHKARTLFLIMKTVAKQLNLPIPQRGFSSHELIEIILNMLEDKDQYLILTLDEIDYVIKMGGSDIIYDLTRLSEERLDSNQRISFIFIMRDLTALHLLEESSRSSLLHNIIRFNPYTSEEICDILWYRIEKEEAMYPEAVSDDVIEFIGDLVGVDKGGRGDARLAIETLWRAGKIAEQEGRSKLTIEDVRKAFSTSMITVSIDFTSLDIHALLILLAATKILKNLVKIIFVFLFRAFSRDEKKDNWRGAG